jgi:hypothetical protein
MIGQNCSPSRRIVEFQVSRSVAATRPECAAPGYVGAGINGFNKGVNGIEKLENLKVSKNKKSSWAL